jgi:hypothetical protein
MLVLGSAISAMRFHQSDWHAREIAEHVEILSKALAERQLIARMRQIRTPQTPQ